MPSYSGRRRTIPTTHQSVADQPLSHTSRLLLAVIVALLFFENAAYGAVEAWSELTALAICAVISLLLAARLVVDRQARLPATVLWAPLTLFMLLVLWQATPLPWGVLDVVAPATAHHKAALLDVQSLPSAAISYYPPETWRMLRLMLVGAAL
ncbi:MAG: hypothetical protein KDA37_13200, partial [Planctomycetales bacterium]|nr:hypothetical protein [Planctomycetales bacterium]